MLAYRDLQGLQVNKDWRGVEALRDLRDLEDRQGHQDLLDPVWVKSDDDSMLPLMML